MNTNLFRVLAFGLLVAECVAQFIAHSQTWTWVFFLLTVAVIAVRWAQGPQVASDRDCPVDCLKCAESASTAARPHREEHPMADSQNTANELYRTYTEALHLAEAQGNEAAAAGLNDGLLHLMERGAQEPDQKGNA